jgi:hypothetical protein
MSSLPFLCGTVAVAFFLQLLVSSRPTTAYHIVVVESTPQSQGVVVINNVAPNALDSWALVAGPAVRVTPRPHINTTTLPRLCRDDRIRKMCVCVAL